MKQWGKEERPREKLLGNNGSKETLKLMMYSRLFTEVGNATMYRRELVVCNVSEPNSTTDGFSSTYSHGIHNSTFRLTPDYSDKSIHNRIPTEAGLHPRASSCFQLLT
ncbi:hypothetical protein V22_00920 [Calycomorphotria hydatis]|uniref:Uncharacterized protein n=1 Tax=Calycomorphotria hydatis TaxID=2528027 RepID=A0A517T3D6_9PLAN|nr:hypothetical protein V22_00920 [Calycomorphotria hydatis]